MIETIIAIAQAAHRLYHYGIFPVFTLTECTVLLAPPATTLTLLNIEPLLLAVSLIMGSEMND